MRKNSSHGTVDQMINAFESKILELSGTDVTSSTQVTAGTKYKRISHHNEFDNGHVLHNWSEMSDEEAEQLACQKSIEDPKDIYFVEYDDIMNPRSDTSWWNGQAYDSSQIAYRAGKPTLLSDEDVTSASNVASDKHVSIDPGDEEIVYSDPYDMFGNLGGVISLEEIKNYWNSNCTYDPSLSMYESFDSWYNDTIQWLSSAVDSNNCTDGLLPIDSGTDVILGKAVPNQTLEYAKEYLDTLSEAIQSEIDSEVDSVVFDSTDREFIVTVSYLGNIREYVVPFGDIVFDYDNMDGDVAYITNTIYQDLDTLGEDEDLEDSGFEEIASKTVPDSDGFTTDYTMYRNTQTGEYVFVFGDKDIYGPEDGDYDWSCDSEEAAWEWYNSYTGFSDDGI